MSVESVESVESLLAEVGTDRRQHTVVKCTVRVVDSSVCDFEVCHRRKNKICRRHEKPMAEMTIQEAVDSNKQVKGCVYCGASPAIGYHTVLPGTQHR